MKKTDYPALIKESLQELQALEKHQEQPRYRDRIRFLRYLKSSLATTQAQAGAIIGLGERQSQNLWRLYLQGGLATLAPLDHKKGYFGKLSSQQYAMVLRYLDTDQVITQRQLIDYIAAEFGISFTQSGICRLCKRLGVKNKTGRPSNVRKDEQGKEAFLKTLLP